MYLNETVAEGPGERLAASVSPGWILSGEEPEVRVRLDSLLGFRDVELSVVVEKTVEGLKDLGRSKIELV